VVRVTRSIFQYGVTPRESIMKKQVTQRELFEEMERVGRKKFFREKTMEQTKINGFFEEFNWLDRHLNRNVGQIYISKIEPSLLRYQLMRLIDILWKPFPVKEEIFEEFYLLDKSGETIISLASFLPTLYDAFDDFLLEEVANEVVFAISYWSYTNAAIIYKSPKGISVPKWIEKQIADEKAKIHAEVEAIDAEYEKPASANSTSYPGPY
jgi:hypothetical protein